MLPVSVYTHDVLHTSIHETIKQIEPILLKHGYGKHHIERLQTLWQKKLQEKILQRSNAEQLGHSSDGTDSNPISVAKVTGKRKAQHPDPFSNGKLTTSSVIQKMRKAKQPTTAGATHQSLLHGGVPPYRLRGAKVDPATFNVTAQTTTSRRVYPQVQTAPASSLLLTQKSGSSPRIPIVRMPEVNSESTNAIDSTVTVPVVPPVIPSLNDEETHNSLESATSGVAENEPDLGVADSPEADDLDYLQSLQDDWDSEEDEDSDADTPRSSSQQRPTSIQGVHHPTQHDNFDGSSDSDIDLESFGDVEQYLVSPSTTTASADSNVDAGSTSYLFAQCKQEVAKRSYRMSKEAKPTRAWQFELKHVLLDRFGYPIQAFPDLQVAFVFSSWYVCM